MNVWKNLHLPMKLSELNLKFEKTVQTFRNTKVITNPCSDEMILQYYEKIEEKSQHTGFDAAENRPPKGL